MGANVLHEETIFPVQSLNIPINLKNTNEPSHPGTFIKNVCEDTSYDVTGLAGKKEFVSLEKEIFKDLNYNSLVNFYVKKKDYNVIRKYLKRVLYFY